LSKKGALKLLNYLSSNADFICEADHFIGHPILGLNKYILNPLITHCFQDNDKEYVNSQFNDLMRTNNFDSDIWNSTDCFSVDDFLKPGLTIYYLDDTELDFYEKNWVSEIFPKHTFKKLPESLTSIENNSWFFIQRNYRTKWKHLLNTISIQNIQYNILHMSDEFPIDNQYSDDISFYTSRNCKKIIRNYCRPDVPNLPHIITIPLGYHYKATENKTFINRSLVWSFHGNSWFNRKVQLENISHLTPHICHFVDKWNSPNMSNKDKYLFDLSNSKFCPILRGNNVETFRLYEALEAGSIPIYIRQEGDELFWKMIQNNLDIKEINNWEEALNLIEQLIDTPDIAEHYRNTLITNWGLWKEKIKTMIYD
jgi:hypothetical protein